MIEDRAPLRGMKEDQPCEAHHIKEPAQNIVWVAPRGGEGPVYPKM